MPNGTVSQTLPAANWTELTDYEYTATFQFRTDMGFSVGDMLLNEVYGALSVCKNAVVGQGNIALWFQKRFGRTEVVMRLSDLEALGVPAETLARRVRTYGKWKRSTGGLDGTWLVRLYHGAGRTKMFYFEQTLSVRTRFIEMFNSAVGRRPAAAGARDTPPLQMRIARRFGSELLPTIYVFTDRPQNERRPDLAIHNARLPTFILVLASSQEKKAIL